MSLNSLDIWSFCGACKTYLELQDLNEEKHKEAVGRITTIYILVNNLSSFQVAKNNFKDCKLYFNVLKNIPLHASVNIVVSYFSGQFYWDCWNIAFKVLGKKSFK